MITKQWLEENLPHGSGINGDWKIVDKGKFFVATNFYETMTDAGFYDAVVDFKVNIPKENPRRFKLTFIGRVSQYQARKNQLRFYLEDLFAEVLK
jgi:hypothetical protein